ncbi:N-acetyltransferase, partial [Candidatus Poribacteria bacterium]|nr:N-acetyltransferase [Candidatus Poribacteria bacterium]
MNEPVISQVQIKDVEFGDGVEIVEPVNLYGCKIGDATRIGPFVEIQKNVTIGQGCKIQSHAFICEWVTIGNDCFISHGAMFINDPFAIGGPARGNKELWCRTKIGDHVSIGTNANILPVTICDNVVVGAGSVITKDILKP